MPRQKKEKGQLRHEPLGKQIQQDEDAKLMAAPRTVKREKQHRQQRRQKDEGFIPNKLSNRALDLAREQREEEEKESVDFEMNNMERSEMRKGGGGGRGGYVSSDDEDYNFDDEEDYEVEDIEISEEDAQALSLWMGPQGPPRTIADLIMEKIKEKEMMLSGALPPEKKLDPKVVEVFTGVGALLARYRSGRLPKAFKLVPSLANWEEILYITNPDGWSPQAVRAATKIFASNLNAKMAQRYYNIILLPHIRNDIEEHKKLNWHLYMALKKAVFKPAAFYKGIVLPLCESRTCTLREATIVGSIMVKCSIPSLHSAVALLKIAEMEYSGANSIFIRILLDKKYALPYRVVDSLITHFTAFVHADKRLPVLWHQALLVFVQRYKELMTVQQKEEIKRLVRAQSHPAITPEIHRELQHSKSRGEVDMKDVTKPQFNPFGGAM